MLISMPDGAVASPAVHRGPAPVDAPPRARERRPLSRETAADPTFTLRRHLARTLGIAAVIAALGGWLAVGAAWWAWLTVPVFWLVANVFEWVVHRYLMHRPMVPRVLYLNHAIVHHRIFTATDQAIHAPRELSLVMMPWYTLLFVFAFASPIALVAALVGGPGLAGVFLLSAVAYFLFYELVHTLHHLPEAMLQRSWWGRRRSFADMRHNHHRHHQLERMTEVNFNVTFAFADRLLGTFQGPAS
jgi:sterol desaturase/sphingolipid hydroxylase (fatty acid hydroxylase superfamily)